MPLVAGEVDLALLKQIAARGPVGMDVQGFVRVREGNELVFKQWPDMHEGLAHITYLKVDRAEAELLTGETDLVRAAQTLAAEEQAVVAAQGRVSSAHGQMAQARGALQAASAQIDAAKKGDG